MTKFLPSTLQPQTRALGAYYTSRSAAQYMVDRVLHGVRTNACVLEPSAGDGIFVDCLRRHAAYESSWRGAVTAVELMESTVAAWPGDVASFAERVIVADFLSLPSLQPDVVVGNPPFVRLRNLSAKHRQSAQRSAQAALGRDMDPAGSVWMPFVLRAAHTVLPGGSLALVLPFEATHVKYARPLWAYLASRFGALTVVRVRERLFPDLSQDVVLLFAAGAGAATDSVDFEAYESVRMLQTGRTFASATLPIAQVSSGAGPFTAALMSSAGAELLGSLGGKTQRLNELAELRVGYVSGDKGFFHPTASDAQTWRISQAALRAALPSARAARAALLSTAEIASTEHLLLPEIATGEHDCARYLAEGVRRGVPLRYKCRVRQPWWRVPQVRVPDVVFPVFSDRPRALVNDAGLVASNSWVGATIGAKAAAWHVATTWRSSLVELQYELLVHALGGGVFVLVPEELARVKLPMEQVTTAAVTRVKTAHQAGGTAGRIAADLVVAECLGVSAESMRTLAEEAAALRRWRKPRIEADGDG